MRTELADGFDLEWLPMSRQYKVITRYVQSDGQYDFLYLNNPVAFATSLLEAMGYEIGGLTRREVGATADAAAPQS